jgi:tape measure domain-containing protein
MADLNRTVGIVFTAEDRGSQFADALARKLKEAGDAAGDAAGKTNQLDRELDKLDKSTPKVSALAVGLQTLAASLVFKSFIDANVELEKFTKSMTATTGSATEAARAFDYVRELSNRLGIETGATADSFAKFAAATKGTSVEGEGAKRIFEAFAGTMSRLGSSSADINGAFVQLAQGISKGKFELEDLKSIAERVPGFFDAFARSLSITTPELFKLISAGGVGATEIAKFAEALNKGLDGAKFDGYINSMARLRNAIDDNLRNVGEAGGFDLLKIAVNAGGTAATASAGAFSYLAGTLKAFKDYTVSGDYEKFTRDLQNVELAAIKVSDVLSGEVNESLAETQRLLRQSGEVQSGLPQAFSEARIESQKLAEEAKKTDAALKTLGLDPRKFDQDVTAIQGAFQRLASDPSVSGDTLLAGLKKTLEQLKSGDQVREVFGQLSQAYSEGKLSLNQYVEQVNLGVKRINELEGAFKGNSKAAKEQEDQLKKNEAQARKTDEQLRSYQLELEKLASNERIKNIEARVTLKVAELENQTKRVVAAFDSINNTVNSTEKSLGDLFGLFKDPNLGFSQIALIRDQIEKENKRRDDALRLQGDLTRAQIDKMKAETDSISRGDALIKIDGAGLQPHLEAFMWEILRTIQTRVNQDGLKLLLGT